MKLQISADLRARLGLGTNATGDDVVAAVSAAVDKKKAGAPRSPQARPLRLTTAADLTDDQVHDLVFGAGDIPPGLTPVVEVKPPAGTDGPTAAEVDAFVLSFCQD